MSQINLAETIQQKLGVRPLKKVSPNTQEIKDYTDAKAIDLVAQAAIPAVLIALYVFVKSDEGAEAVLSGNKSSNWVESLYLLNKEEVMHKIASYVGTDDSTAEKVMEQIALLAVNTTRENLPTNATIKDVRSFFANQRDKILIYLPGYLQIGNALKDDTLDDRTNKMDGPVSGFMHSVEKAFSNSAKKDDN